MSDSDLVNGLRHMAEDHPCCEPTIIHAIDSLRQLERENAALKTALDHQMNYQRELRADRDRLNWLMTQKHIRYPFAPHDDGKVLRERIDAAMKEGQP